MRDTGNDGGACRNGTQAATVTASKWRRLSKLPAHLFPIVPIGQKDESRSNNTSVICTFTVNSAAGQPAPSESLNSRCLPVGDTAARWQNFFEREVDGTDATSVGALRFLAKSRSRGECRVPLWYAPRWVSASISELFELSVRPRFF